MTMVRSTKVRSIAGASFLVGRGWEPYACSLDEYNRPVWTFDSDAYVDLEAYMETRDRLARMEAVARQAAAQPKPAR